MLKICHLAKQFRKKHGVVKAIREASLAIAPGEFVSLTGPSGGGKSTLLLMLGDMEASKYGYTSP